MHAAETQSPVLTSLSHSSAHMKAASPAFIVGHPRSGTSLLYRIMQQHSAFRPSRVDLNETQIFLHVGRAFRFDADPPKQLLRFMLKDRTHFDAFLQETRLLRRSTVLTAPAALPLRGDLPLALWRAQGMHLVVRSYLWHAWSARGCARLLEKSPRNVPHVDKLLLVSPSAKMIFMSRHPVDVFSSYRKRAKVDPKAGWANTSRSRFTRIYRNAVRGALEQSRSRPESFLLTRYEDFVQDPAREFGRICAFVGEPFEEAALQESPDTATMPSRYHRLYGAIETNTKRWRDVVHVDDARRVETELLDVMAQLGYPRYT